MQREEEVGEAAAASQAAHGTAETPSLALDSNDAVTNTVENGNGRRHSRDVIKSEDDDDEEQSGEIRTRTSLRPHPVPSVKRRASQATSERPQETEQQTSKKRKRGPSPPWQFPTAERTTLTSKDGRRISARFSTNTTTPVVSESEGRARSSSLSAPPRSSRAASPPWKKFEAEGPSSVMVDGQRKSGRVHKELTEGGKPKRISPRSHKVVNLDQPHLNGPSKATLPDRGKGHARKASKSAQKDVSSVTNAIDEVEEHHAKLKALQAKLAELQPTRSFPPEDQPIPMRASHKRKRSSHGGQPPHLDGPSSPPTQRKTPGHSKAPQAPEASNKRTPKLKLRFNSARHIVPPPHPNAIPPSPPRPPRPSLHQLLDDCDLREMQQPYMENERGPPSREWFEQRAIKQAEDERVLRQRILKEAEPGGLLSRELCSVYDDAEPQAEPPPVYTHIDHLMNHVRDFRERQTKEAKNHKIMAKKIANEALEYWKKMRGPTEEDIRAEQDRIFKLIYKQVVVDVKAKWELVAQHVHVKRLQAWEAEQEIKRQQRLQEKLAKSESMVARQRGALEDSAGDADGSAEGADASDESEQSSGDDNISESGDEGGDEDEGEMDEAALEAYMAAREKEAMGGSDGGEVENDGDVQMTDIDPPLGPTGPETGPDTGFSIEVNTGADPGAGLPSKPKPLPLPKPHATAADLFVEEDNESAEDTKPTDIESQATNGAHARASEEGAQRTPHSSATPAADDATYDSEDDSSVHTDTYGNDSDDDMSSTGEEDNAQGSDDEDDDDDDDVSDEPSRGSESLGKGLLGFYSAKDQQKQLRVAGLPTPTTSAEGDAGDVNAHDDTKRRGSSAGAERESETAKTDGDTAAPASATQMSTVPRGDSPAASAEPMEYAEEVAQGEAAASPSAVEKHQDYPMEVEEVAQEEAVASPSAVEEHQDYPMEVEDVAREEVAASPSAMEEDEDEDEPRYTVPEPVLLRGKLRTYQHAGLEWLASLYRNGTNGILADEMGLGKTIQTISLLAHLAEEYGCWETHLVIVPTSVVLNWVTEFQKFLPGFRVLAYYGTSEERSAKRKGWVNDPHLDDKSKRGYNVVVTSYNIAMQDIAAIRSVQWHYLVLDEAHNIRNFNSQRWQTLIRLKTHARLLLTGTPLQNSLTELWSLLTFLTAGDDDPQHGDLEEFLSHWRDPVREIFDAGVQTLSAEAQRVVDQLHISLRPFLLRRLKSEVEKDLPKKTESVVVCKLSKRQRQLYQEYMGLAEVKKSLAQGNAVSAGKVLLSLRRVCNHPDLFDPRGVETSWGMERSVVEEFGVKESVVMRLLDDVPALPSMLMVTAHQGKSSYAGKRARKLSANPKMTAELANLEKTIDNDTAADPSTIEGCRAVQRVRARQQQLDKLRATIRLSDDNLAASPIYGSDLQELVTVKRNSPYKVKVRPSPVQQPYGQPLTRPPQAIAQNLRGWPQLGNRPLLFESEHPSDWLIARESMLQQSVQTLAGIGEKLHETITRFAFVTPNVTAPVLDFLIPQSTQRNLRATAAYPLDTDYAHESRVRLSIAFPDARLLVYDSGKLQRLTHLLRELQAKGSRSLIFTQMTGTLNILEQFLSLMGLPYLRLDGSTTPERRHLYAQEFNRPDSKYQCMILSSRAGGVGLNLTGASSVIFYDLDWNPQMDRQCMDRAHRIGQVRDVEVYKMVSEKTVEENILRRAEQKSLLDQAVIQEGHFTTDYEIGGGKAKQDDGDAAADGENEEEVAAAIERFLGTSDNANDKSTAQALESVEDREDVAAAQRAHKEAHQDEADFGQSSHQPSGRATPATGLGADVDVEALTAEGHLDGYLVRFAKWAVEGTVFVPPVVKKTGRARDRVGGGGRRRR